MIKNFKNRFLFPAGTIIEVVGNVASGKTTLSRHLTRISNLVYTDLEIYDKNKFLPLYVNDQKRWAFQTGLQFSYDRAQKLSSILKQKEWEPLVFDQGFDMGIFVYSKTSFLKQEMIEEEWILLQKFHDLLFRKTPPIYATIFIDTPTNEIMRRIVQRGRDHEQEYTQKYVKLLQERLEEYKKDVIALQTRKFVLTYHQLENRIEFHGKEDKKIQKLFSLL